MYFNSDQIGPSEGHLYTCTTSFATDIYGKKLEYSSCSVDIAIVNPEPDTPEIGGDGNGFDFIIMCTCQPMKCFGIFRKTATAVSYPCI